MERRRARVLRGDFGVGPAQAGRARGVLEGEPVALAVDLRVWGSVALSFQEHQHQMCWRVWCEAGEQQCEATTRPSPYLGARGARDDLAGRLLHLPGAV